MQQRLLCQLTFASVLLTSSAACFAGGWGLGGKLEIGANRAKIDELNEASGAEIGVRIIPALRLRANQSKLDYQIQTQGDIAFQESLEQDNTRVTVDWFPWAESGQWFDGFYTSAGAVRLDKPSTINSTINPTLNYTLNGNLYSAAQLGNISGSTVTNRDVPYLGLGYEYTFNRRHNGSGWYAQAEVGQISHLEPTLQLQTTSTMSAVNQDLQTYAQQESAKLKDSYTLYGITFGYRF